MSQASSLRSQDQQLKKKKTKKEKNTGTTGAQPNGAASASTNGKESTNSSELEKELKREKKLRKALKEALLKEQEKAKTFELELDKVRKRCDELEKENREKENKYLDLYMENTSQHEQIVTLQSSYSRSNSTSEV